MGRFDDRVVVVTGGNSGIGLASARGFAREGARVALFGRNAETLAAAKEEVGEGTLAVQGDVSNVADLDRLFAEVHEHLGPIDVLFANAGLGQPGELADISEDHFALQFDTNVKGMLFTVQRALPHLKDGASVLLTSSVVSEMAMPGMGVYAATKAATRSLVQTLTLELAPRGIRVNSIAPGPIETGFFGRIDLPEDQLEAMAASIRESVPMKRFGTSEEVANVALFLASGEASFVNGADFVVDGGISLHAVG